MTAPLIARFANARTANRLVAGVPAAARVAAALGALRPGMGLVLVSEDAEHLAPRTRAAIARLAPAVSVTITAQPPAEAWPGEVLVDPAALAALLAGRAPPPPPPADPDAVLGRIATTIIRATAKPGDGMIARHINRPLSQAISGQLLRLAWIRPGHATGLTALAGLAMFACLIAFPTPAGLAAGAVLFQIASVIDGVDGEIARAAQRTSRRGASLDSLTDAATNCAFLAGAGISLALQGDTTGALVCAGATGLQVAGLAILGRAAWLREGVVHFDGAKSALQPAGRGPTRAIKDVTSRDFYAFAFMLAALAGQLSAAAAVFMAGSAVWLAFVLLAQRQPAPARLMR